MFRENISSRRLTAWLFAGITPVAIQLVGGASWMWTLVTVGVSLLAVLLRWRWGAVPGGRLFSFLGWITAVLVLGTLAPKAVDSWPTGDQAAVPLLLLALATWSAIKGPSAAAKVGCVLYWFVFFVYILLFASGIREAEPRWILQCGENGPWLIVPLLLTPAAATVLTDKRGQGWGRLVTVGVFTLTGSLIILGVLGSAVTVAEENGFYEMTRSLSLFDTARRFEAVISAAMTAGWFCIMSLFLTLCGSCANRHRQGWGRRGVALGAIAAGVMVLCGLHIPGKILVLWTSVFWVVTPLVTQWVEGRKKS